ncbi:MAG: hypothetical protein ACPGJS_17610 [Flammeovirgaceae bacterium]
MDTVKRLEQENRSFKKFLSMDFQYSLFYIKSASDQLKQSETMDPRHQAELLQGISLAIDKSIQIMEEVNAVNK